MNDDAPAARPSAAERVAAELRDRIIDGSLRCGTQLIEESVSAQMGASRNTVRESFTLLGNERLVRKEANRGVFVVTPTRADVTDLYRTRRMIEPAALDHGPGLTEELVAILRRCVTNARGAATVYEVAQANQQFHSTVVQAAGSTRLTRLMAGLLAEMRLVFQLLDDDPGFHLPYVARNDAIVTLLENGHRSAAARALDEYLADAAGDLLSRPTLQGH